MNVITEEPHSVPPLFCPVACFVLQPRSLALHPCAHPTPPLTAVYTRVLCSHMFISSHLLLCPLPFYHLTVNSSVPPSLSVSLGFGIHRRLADTTRTLDTTQQHHRHVGLRDHRCTCRGPRPRYLHQHQGWPGQMVGDCTRVEKSYVCVCFICTEEVSHHYSKLSEHMRFSSHRSTIKWAGD